MNNIKNVINYYKENNFVRGGGRARGGSSEGTKSAVEQVTEAD